MLSTTKKVHTSLVNLENFSILLVSPYPEDLTAVRRILHHSDWQIARSDGAKQAAKHLTQNACSILICERDLPDGSWKDVLQQTASLQHPPMILVMSRHADEGLWAEVLNLGGYDVLLKPFDNHELTRVVGMAWRHWSGSFLGKKANSASASVSGTYPRADFSIAVS
ncbi:MAG TPA: response regulator [Bryobacteraceae bacterium]|nr:response regulator [Bryobacteraceae bacterium]